MSLSTKFLILLLTAGALFFGGYFLGKSDEREDQIAASAVAKDKTIEQAVEVAKKDDAVATGHEIKRETRRAVAKQLDKEIQQNVAANPAYFECGLDADGLRLWNSANAGHSLDGPGQHDAGVPRLAPGGGWKLGHAGKEPQGSGGPVSRMPGSESGQGRGDSQP